MKVPDNNFTCLPFVVWVRVWNVKGDAFDKVIAYLESDGKYHLDEEGLNRASEALKTPVDELYV